MEQRGQDQQPSGEVVGRTRKRLARCTHLADGLRERSALMFVYAKRRGANADERVDGVDVGEDGVDDNDDGGGELSPGWLGVGRREVGRSPSNYSCRLITHHRISSLGIA